MAVPVGITGLQGGSVARALIDSTSPEAFAGQGVEIVSVSLTVDNAANVRKAFAGADIVFAVTNFNEHMDKQRGLMAGGIRRKMLVDSAKAVGVKLFIWSALESLSALSGGKYSRVGFFDAKSEVTAHAKQSGVPLAVVEAGYYATNVFEAVYALKKLPDGRYVFGLPIPATTQVPVIDVAHDYGLYVRAAIELPALGPGAEVLSGTLISFGEMVATRSETVLHALLIPGAVPGKKITYVEFDRETFIGSDRDARLRADAFRHVRGVWGPWM
ncbi:NAD(P)-binding protein [Mycena vitilis]|nr:NAD(P)-binding protein [Mycena vitilis]